MDTTCKQASAEYVKTCCLLATRSAYTAMRTCGAHTALCHELRQLQRCRRRRRRTQRPVTSPLRWRPCFQAFSPACARRVRKRGPRTTPHARTCARQMQAPVKPELSCLAGHGKDASIELALHCIALHLQIKTGFLVAHPSECAICTASAMQHVTCWVYSLRFARLLAQYRDAAAQG
jgi:hypothetical protein